MAIKITDFPKDIPILNQELAKFDVIDTQLKQLQSHNETLQQQVAQLKGLQDGTSSNSLLASWTGATGTISWVAGFVRNTSHEYAPFGVGSHAGLAANTNYWMAWNPTQTSMSIQQDINKLMNVQTLLVICRVFTGTAGQSGPLGCGGTEPVGTGINGKEYKLF